MVERAAPGRDRATESLRLLKKRDPPPPNAPFTERDSIASWRLSSHSSLSSHISTGTENTGGCGRFDVGNCECFVVEHEISVRSPGPRRGPYSHRRPVDFR